MQGFSIIIVTWNGLHHLKTFLPSVATTDYPDYEIILADNASSDETRIWVTDNYPKVKIATFDANYGYCGGNNRAAEIAQKDILLFLNNDVEVTPDWLNKINDAFENNANIGAAQPKILAYERKDYFEYAGAGGGLIDGWGYTFCRGRIFDHVEDDHGQFEEQTDIFWASGAALAIRNNLFKELGGFDEDFEFHMEEIDLCWRVQRAGYKVSYIPKSSVYHLGGGSLPMGSSRKVYYNFRNNLFMLWKNASPKFMFIRFPIRFVLDIVAAWKSLFSGNPHEFLAIAKAHIHFFLLLNKIHKKRKNSSLARPSSLTGQFNFMIIWSYFFKGRRNFRDLHLDEN